MLYEQKDHKISECQNVVQSAIEFMVTLVVDSRFVAIVYSYYKIHVVIGSYLQTIVVAYHEFHKHSKTLHQQVTMVHND